MKRFASILFVLLFCLVARSFGETVTTAWGGNAEFIYNTGFMEKCMLDENGAVRLFDMDLIQNDAPGASFSTKGIHHDIVWGNNRARKILFLNDARTHKAWLVFYFRGKPGKYPLSYTINGRPSAVSLWNPEKDSREAYRWVEFPAEWLRKGDNVIELFCPEAANEEEGWDLQLARADEFIDGGGDPKDVGKTSFKSFDGGKTWKQSPFGEDGKTRAEYNIRLSLDRFLPAGFLASPVIDLWRGDSRDFIVPLRTVETLRLAVQASTPPGTTVEYFLRKGTDPGPFSDAWEPYVPVGSGESLTYSIDGFTLNRRYIQFKAVLSTTNPLASPTIKSAKVECELREDIPLHKNISIVECDNPSIQYSSVNWEWEPWNRPEFAELRKRENLDEVISSSKTEFGAQVRLMEYASNRWYIGTPYADYPGWDALSIVKRVNKDGAGGMCIQFNLFLGGLCMSYGWQAKFSNTTGHEVIEIWNDDFGKWIFFDATNTRGLYTDNYNYLNTTGEPQSLYDLHKLYLDYYFPNRAIDWMNDYIFYGEVTDGKPFPVSRGSRVYPKPEYSGTKTYLSGFSNAAHLRTVTRNNWYEKPTPRPLNHGQSWWPWDGYLNWYDSRTPRNRQYSWHTDRPRDMWPDLNKVHIDATSSFANNQLFLHFETYTPNFSHFEVDDNRNGWKETDADWTWFLDSGRNTLEVRAVNKLGVKGKPSTVIINHADVPPFEFVK